MGIGDLLGDAENLINSPEGQAALHSDQAEGISDGILDKLEDAVEGATGHKFDGAVEAGRGMVDGQVGDK